MNTFSQIDADYLPELLKESMGGQVALPLDIPSEHLVEMYKEAGAQLFALRAKVTRIETFYLFLHTAVAGYVLSTYQPTEKYRQLPLRIAETLGLGDVFPRTTLEHLTYWCLAFGHKLATGTFYEGLEPDELYQNVLHYLKNGGIASTPAFQREFKIGYGRAARIMDYLENEGVVTTSDGTNHPRKFLLS